LVDVAKDAAFAALFEVTGAYLIAFFSIFKKYDVNRNQNRHKKQVFQRISPWFLRLKYM
jgi:hypothetical protein